MKGIALILAFVIFSTSVKASSFIGGVIDNIGNGASISTCCKAKSPSNTQLTCEIDQEKEPQEEEKDVCCKDGDCDCTCCLHIAYMINFGDYSFISNDFSNVKFGYSFIYQADFLTSVFHPPLRL